jgi:predicted transcriptional regulator
MAMTLRLTEEDDAALTAMAQREHASKHEIVLRALRQYTGGRQQRLEAATARVVERDRELLDRLGQ